MAKVEGLLKEMSSLVEEAKSIAEHLLGLYRELERRRARFPSMLLECGTESLKCPVLQTVFANIVWNR
jgi:hypothetical protein